MEKGRSRGQRAGLSRASVLAAARAVIAERGLAAASMRAIAAKLGVAPNALYNHAENKEDLLDAVMDEVLAQVEPPRTGAPLQRVRTTLTRTFDALVAHPDVAPLFLSRRRGSGAHSRRLTTDALQQLARAGLAQDQALRALRALLVYTFGFATAATRPVVDPGASKPLSATRLRREYTDGLAAFLDGLVPKST